MHNINFRINTEFNYLYNLNMWEMCLYNEGKLSIDFIGIAEAADNVFCFCQQAVWNLTAGMLHTVAYTFPIINMCSKTVPFDLLLL